MIVEKQPQILRPLRCSQGPQDDTVRERIAKERAA